MLDNLVIVKNVIVIAIVNVAYTKLDKNLKICFQKQLMKRLLWQTIFARQGVKYNLVNCFVELMTTTSKYSCEHKITNLDMNFL